MSVSLVFLQKSFFFLFFFYEGTENSLQSKGLSKWVNNDDDSSDSKIIKDSAEPVTRGIL